MGIGREVEREIPIFSSLMFEWSRYLWVFRASLDLAMWWGEWFHDGWSRRVDNVRQEDSFGWWLGFAF